MRRRLLGMVMLALVAMLPVAFTSCGDEGPSCCTLARFCSACTTCTTDQTITAARHDEVACKALVDKFSSMSQFCNPDDKPPKHTIEEFAMQCQQ
jgi:hypothetical protein